MWVCSWAVVVHHSWWQFMKKVHNGYLVVFKVTSYNQQLCNNIWFVCSEYANVLNPECGIRSRNECNLCRMWTLVTRPPHTSISSLFSGHKMKKRKNWALPMNGIHLQLISALIMFLRSYSWSHLVDGNDA